MRSLAGVMQMIVRLCGVVQIVLGLLIWTGVARPVGVHMLVGILLVIGLWVLSVLAAAARAGVGLALGGFVLGAFTVWFGLVHGRLLPGGAHWVVQVLHLLIGVAAIGTGDFLGNRVKGSAAATA